MHRLGGTPPHIDEYIMSEDVLFRVSLRYPITKTTRSLHERPVGQRPGHWLNIPRHTHTHTWKTAVKKPRTKVDCLLHLFPFLKNRRLLTLRTHRQCHWHFSFISYWNRCVWIYRTSASNCISVNGWTEMEAESECLNFLLRIYPD